MAKINIDLGQSQGDLVANKGQDIILPYTIYPPVAEDSDAKDYVFDWDTNSNMFVPNEEGIEHTKDDWVKVNSFSINKALQLVTNGVKYPLFKYKIDFITIDGEIIQELLPYQEEFIDLREGSISDEVTIPITLLTSSVVTYAVKITVLFESGNVAKASRPVLLYNIDPTIIVAVQKNTVYLTIGDDDQDLVRFNIYLNGKKVFPEDEQFTDWQPPLSTSVRLDSDSVLVGEVNRVVVNVEDEWGGRNTAEHLFIGQYFGVLFADEQGKYYSDDLGQILRTLNFGLLTAGTTSNVEKVRIYNQTSDTVSKITLSSDKETKPNLMNIYYGWTPEGLTEDIEPLIYTEKIKDGEYIELFLQVKLDLEYEERHSTFDTVLEAETIPDGEE